MKIFLIAAISADGFIAKDSQHSPLNWTSKEDKKRLIELTKKAGVVVMGSRTYATIGRPLKERINIVYTKDKSFEGVETTQKTPQELIAELEGRGFNEVAILGGSHIYNMFMKVGVIDTLYLTIEPIIFGSGVKLFTDEMLYHMKLVSSVITEGGSVMLEYKVDARETVKE
jgi:dihydrofolate reductase